MYMTLFKIARYLVFDKSVYKIVSGRSINRITNVSLINLHKKVSTTIIMPPKRKREAKKPEEVEDETNVAESNTRTKLKRTAKKEIPLTPSDSDSEEEVRKKPGKKSKASKKKTTEDGDAKPKKGRKKAKVDADESEEEIIKPSRGRGKPKTKQDDEEVEDDDEPEDEKPAKGRKPKAEKAPAKNKTATSYEEIDFNNCTRKNEKGEDWNFKISNWNVDGIRAWLKKGGLDYIQYEKPDILCLQETKCSLDKLPPEVKEIEGYKAYWHCSDKDGYAGVALYSKIEPLSIEYGVDNEEHDDEGRMVTAEYEKFYVISVYVPNAGRGLTTLPKRLTWNEAFRNYVAQLDKKKPVIVCGDMNVAHLEIDLSNPKTNTKNAGFTKEERDGMTEFLGDGYVDTFREIYPDKTQAYTFWTYMMNCRAKNVGWRLDYFIVSKRLMESVCDNIIRDEVFGSDHCPISLFLTV